MRILVLGGYGHFGGRICRSLAADAGMDIVVAGRDQARADAFIAAIPSPRARLAAAVVDAEAPDLATRIGALAPDLVIHTAGPFQGRDYAVAAAALDSDAHYIDLADGRGFVAGIGALDAAARSAQRWVISGASSVPGLSAAAVAALRPRFACLDHIEIGISPGNRTPRGLATTRAILGYVGQSYPVLIDGRWRPVHGWQSLRRIVYPGLGTRWLARCEVPDLTVLPQRYPELATCDFRAGLELRRMHFGLWLGSWLVRSGVIDSLQPWSERLLALSNRWLDAGSDAGVMHVDMRGTGTDGQRLCLRWTLFARDGDGPRIPCTAAILLARKLGRGKLPGCGARPCLDLFTLDEFLQTLRGHALETTLERLPD